MDIFLTKSKNLDAISPPCPNFRILRLITIITFSSYTLLGKSEGRKSGPASSFTLRHPPVKLCLTINSDLVWPIYSIFYIQPFIAPCLIKTIIKVVHHDTQ